MAETEFLVRADRDHLKALDHGLAALGFKTRAEWVREQMRKAVAELKRRQLLKDLEAVTIPGITDEEIVAMVRDWRREDKERGLHEHHR